MKIVDVESKSSVFLFGTGVILILITILVIGKCMHIDSVIENNQSNDNLIIKSITPIPISPKIEVSKLFKYLSPEKRSKELNTGDSQEIRLMATGDVIPARSVNFQMVKRNDFRYPFLKTADLLNTADIVFINLESPLVPKCSTTVEGMIFCGNERAVGGFNFANVKIASLANNHIGNYGNDGIDNTIKLLEKNNISVTGVNEKQTILTIKGKKFGFLGYNDIEKNDKLKISLAYKDAIATEVASLKKETDFVIVAFHWGIEYNSNPTSGQKELAHLAIDNGADLIIGNHPHWVQGVEIYKNRFISYAHGNFIFDQMWSRETREGVVGEYVFGENGLKDVSYYPVVIEDYAQPRFAKEEEADKILKRMEESTKQILLDNRM